MHISLSHLRNNLVLFNSPENIGLLCYLEWSLNFLIHQLSGLTHGELLMPYIKEEFLGDDEDNGWDTSPTIPLRQGELDEIYQI